MKKYEVVFTPEAVEQLMMLYHRIATDATPEVAWRYTSAVQEYCEGLTTFPLRGKKRDDIRPGLRTTAYRRRTEIAYTIQDTKVAIIGVFHGGQNYEAALKVEDPDD
jgi:plasmid stabilization system protein ParE